MTVDDLLAALWRDYTASTPQAARIHALLAARGEAPANDHVALRTFGVPLASLARTFEQLGWQPTADRYHFADKHLDARYWRNADPRLPKLFVSELDTTALSPPAQAIVADLVAQLPAGFTERADLAWAGRPWTITHAAYARLLAESEYAAWVAAFGFRVNHFTVDVGSLTTFPDLRALVTFLEARGERLNTSGGVIKGTRADHLEQASTLADAIDVTFSDQTARIPSCYYEFAQRHALPSGARFEGFVPASADRIFESTDAARR